MHPTARFAPEQPSAHLVFAPRVSARHFRSSKSCQSICATATLSSHAPWLVSLIGQKLRGGAKRHANAQLYLLPIHLFTNAGHGVCPACCGAVTLNVINNSVINNSIINNSIINSSIIKENVNNSISNNDLANDSTSHSVIRSSFIQESINSSYLIMDSINNSCLVKSSISNSCIRSVEKSWEVSTGLVTKEEPEEEEDSIEQDTQDSPEKDILGQGNLLIDETSNPDKVGNI